MPTIAIVDGVVILIYPKDHAPPHIHAKFAEHECLLNIYNGDLLAGNLPKKKLAKVQSWLEDHRQDVAFAWDEMRQGRTIKRTHQMNHRIVKVEASNFPNVFVEFDDGLNGNIDLSKEIAEFPMFEPLRNRELFLNVKLDKQGSRIGWKLEDVGNEIDLCADAIRIDFETLAVKKMAAEYRAKLKAAE